MSTYSASINLVRFSMCISGVTQLVCGLVEQGPFGCPIDYYNYYFICLTFGLDYLDFTQTVHLMTISKCYSLHFIL